jgi:hypothetical protein
MAGVAPSLIIFYAQEKVHAAVLEVLTTTANPPSKIAGIHARFSWLKGAGGFFLIADNKRRKKVMMNGE